MDIKIIRDEKHALMFELSGATHAFCNILKDTLTQDPDVVTASYRIEHPLTSQPKFLIETNSKTDPRKAIKGALAAIRKTNEAFLKATKDL